MQYTYIIGPFRLNFIRLGKWIPRLTEYKLSCLVVTNQVLESILGHKQQAPIAVLCIIGFRLTYEKIRCSTNETKKCYIIVIRLLA